MGVIDIAGMHSLLKYQNSTSTRICWTIIPILDHGMMFQPMVALVYPLLTFPACMSRSKDDLAQYKKGDPMAINVIAARHWSPILLTIATSHSLPHEVWNFQDTKAMMINVTIDVTTLKIDWATVSGLEAHQLLCLLALFGLFCLLGVFRGASAWGSIIGAIHTP